MTTDNEQFAPELLPRNGRVSEPEITRLTTVRPDRAGGDPQLDYVSEDNPLPVSVQPTPELWVSDWVAVPYGATSGALDANDALGDPFRFPGVPVKGRILSIEMIDRDDDTLAATIHIFNQRFTAAASDAAFTIGLADATNQVASELFDSGTDEGAYKYHVIKNVNKEYYAPGRTLHCQLSSTGTPNLASAAVTPLVKLSILPLE